MQKAIIYLHMYAKPKCNNDYYLHYILNTFIIAYKIMKNTNNILFTHSIHHHVEIMNRGEI